MRWKMTEFIPDKTDIISNMYNHVGYLSPEGVFYKERKINEKAQIESDLFAWSLLKTIKLENAEPNISVLKKIKQELKEAFTKSSEVLVKNYGFIRVSDERGYIAFSGISNTLSAKQEYILKFLSEYYNQKDNNLHNSVKR